MTPNLARRRGRLLAAALSLAIVGVMIWLLAYQPPEHVSADTGIEPPVIIIIGPVEKMPEPQFTFQAS